MEEKTSEVISTGIAGLDDILLGGITPKKMYLLSGTPGTGKTTFALQFIAEGIRNGERCLYISVGLGGEDFVALAKAADIDLDPDLFTLHTVEISDEILEGPEQRIFHPAEVEPAGGMTKVLAEVSRVKPKRLVIDSLSDLRLVAEDLVNFRRLVLAMRRQFNAEECTVLITNNVGQSEIDSHLETICHGVIRLEQVVHGYGPVRRRLLVVKLRGRAYRSGWHDFRIVTGGLRVFPTLIFEAHRQQIQQQTELIPSGNERLDLLFGGGIDRGTTTAIIGASGTGKTTLSNQYAVAAAKRGERVAIYLFDETEDSFCKRARGIGLAVDGFIESGRIMLRSVEVSEFSAGEFTADLRREVEMAGARVVVIDTLSGYNSAMMDDKYLTTQLHELLTYLSHRSVTTMLVMEQHGIFGTDETELKNVSYLADAILLLRFFEHRGEIRRAISVVKKRTGNHENAIRELTISGNGIVIGEPLKDMQGVLTGVPVFEG